MSETIETPDGRVLEVVADGPDGGDVLIFHPGTPNGPLAPPTVVAAAAERGLRTVVYARPGYGASTPQPGRKVADAAADTATVLDHVGADRFWNAGWSGGGPHALAAAALLPDRCRATAVLAGVAPYPAEGIDWADGMDAQNVEEFRLSTEGAEALTPGLEAMASLMTGVSPEQLKESLGGLLSGVDREVAEGPFANFLADSMRTGVASGIAGWRDDDVAFVTDWGFDLGRAQRVLLFQGAHDHMVPAAHAVWLAERLPGAELHLFDDEGHLSLPARLATTVIDALLAKAAH
jgi:pimeloyl-ACP methyl ester carboxylesterase